MLRCSDYFSLRITTIVGFGLDRTVSMVAYSMYLERISKQSDSLFLGIAAGSVLCAIVFLVLTGNLTSLRNAAHQDKYMTICASSAAVGLILMYVFDHVAYYSLLGPMVFGASALLVSTGSAGLFFRWGCLLSSDGGRNVLFQMGAGFAAALVAIVPLNLVSFDWQIVVLLILCGANACCLRHLAKEQSECSFSTDMPRDKASFCRKKMLVGMAFYGLAMGLSSSLLQHTGQAVFLNQSILRVAFGLLTSGIIVAVFIRRGASTVSVYRFAYVVIALNTAALFLFPFATELLRAFLFIGHLLLIIVCMSLLFCVAHGLPDGRESFVALGIAAFLGGDLVTRGSHDLVSFTGTVTAQDFSLSLAFALVALVVIGYSLVFTEHDIKKIESALTGGSERQEGEEISRSDSGFLSYSEEAATQFGLTPRETEILRLLLLGRSSPRIQAELFISESTVHTHMRHIYAKMGIHSRQELIDLAVNNAQIFPNSTEKGALGRRLSLGTAAKK